MESRHKCITLEHISNLLERVGEIDGIKGLRLNAEGAAKLRLNGDKEVFFEYSRERDIFFVYRKLFGLPSDPAKRAALLEGLLSSNFLRMHSGPGEHAVDPDSNAVIYQIGIDPATLTTEKLDRYIDICVKQEADAADFIHLGNRPAPQVYSGRPGGAMQDRLVKLAGSRIHGEDD